MREVGRQWREEGECSPRDERELRTKTGERSQEKPLAQAGCPPPTPHMGHNTRMSGASPSGKHKHSDSPKAKPEEVLGGSKHRFVQPCFIAGAGNGQGLSKGFVKASPASRSAQPSICLPCTPAQHRTSSASGLGCPNLSLP